MLRAAVAGDRQRWLELFQDPMELRFGVPAFVPLPLSLDDLDERVESSARALAVCEPGNLVVASEDDPERFLGTFGWRRESPPLRIADVGYAVHPDSRGRGVASRGLRVLTRWLTVDEDGPRLPRVQLDHSVDNIASCRTALGAGFAQEGIRRHYLPLRDQADPDGQRRHDVCLHGFVSMSPADESGPT